MGGKSQKVTNETKVPAFIEAAYKDLIARASPVANTPYDPATERGVAGFAAPQTQAFGQIQSTQGIQSPYIGQAADWAAQGVSPVSGAEIGNYLNPYTRNVIDTTMADISRNNAIQQQQLKGNSVAQGGLRNSRLGVAQAELAGNQDRNTAATLANLNSQNYNQALAAAQGDKSRAFQGASAYSALGQQAQNASYQDIAALLGSGAQQQGLEQLQLDTASQNAAQRYQQPFDSLSWLAGITQGVGSSAGSTSTQTSPGPSALSQIAGVGLTALGMFSDERVKEGEKLVGETFDGQPIYTFRYKGDPRTHMGLMAQDVEQSHPDAVGSVGGIKTVNYDRATDGAAERGHFNAGGQVGGSHMDDIMSRVAHATKGISAIQKANGGRTEEPQGIGSPRGFAGGGMMLPDLFSNAMASGNVASNFAQTQAADKSLLENALGGIGFKNVDPAMMAAGLGMITSDKSDPLAAIAEGGMRGIDQHRRTKRRDEARYGFAAGGFPGFGDDEEDETSPLDLYGVTDDDYLAGPAVTSTAMAPTSSGWQGLGVPREKLPAGMRNNNPGNIKYFKGLNYPGLVGPSENTDQGDPQMVFDTPQSGMNAAASLALRKYQGGKRSARDIISGEMGWTPGNVSAADNIARTMGIDPGEDLRLDDPKQMQSFLRALTMQEHGASSKLYGDDVYAGVSSGRPVVSGGDAGARDAAVRNAIDSAQPKAGIGASAAEEKPSGLSSIFGNLGKDVNLPLLAAGLGILGGDSPFAGVNIGKGGLAGVQMVMQQRKAKEGAKKLAEAAQLAQQRLGIQQESLAERKRHNMEIEKKGGEAAFSKNVIWGVGPDGQPALLQPGTKGEAVATKLPEGFKVAKDPIKIDAGTEWILLDPQTRQPVGKIPKNVAAEAAERTTGEAEAKLLSEGKAKLPNVERATTETLGLIDRLDTDPMRQSFTGYSGYLPNVSPKANDYQALLDQVKGNTFLQAFDSLRGAGAITEQEGKAATAALTRLQAVAPSDEGYQIALDDTRRVLREILGNARKRAGIEPSPEADPTGQASPQRAGDQPNQITSKAEYDALPPGTRYIDPNGKPRTKQ